MGLLGAWAVLALGACPGQESLLKNPVDPAARGPYTVGAAKGSVSLGEKRDITVEVYYPAKAGSAAGKSGIVYDIREHIPPPQAKKLAGATNETQQHCDCFYDLPIADGVFPVVVMIHGTAAFRTASMHQQTHWASRGFVVAAADHPGIQLYDLLNVVNAKLPPRTDQAGDARGMLIALENGNATGFDMLNGHMDFTKVGMVGHSAGGMALKDLGDVADVLIPMSGYAPNTGSRLKSTLVLSAENDTIVDYTREVKDYENCKASPKRFAAVSKLGHLFCTDLCYIGEDAGGVVKIAENSGIWVARGFEGLGMNGCAYQNPTKGTDFLAPECGWQFTNYVTAAAFEEVLRCDAGMTDALKNVETQISIPKGCPQSLVYAYEQSL